MPAALDGKFYGVIYRHKDNQVEPPDGFMVFCARDDALPATLKFYLEECERQGAEKPQIMAIQALRDRVAAWREKHPDRCHVADVEPGEL